MQSSLLHNIHYRRVVRHIGTRLPQICSVKLSRRNFIGSSGNRMKPSKFTHSTVSQYPMVTVSHGYGHVVTVSRGYGVTWLMFRRLPVYLTQTECIRSKRDITMRPGMSYHVV